MPACVCNHAEG